MGIGVFDLSNFSRYRLECPRQVESPPKSPHPELKKRKKLKKRKRKECESMNQIQRDIPQCPNGHGNMVKEKGWTTKGTNFELWRCSECNQSVRRTQQ